MFNQKKQKIMENCLVTKLKGTVNNPDLYKLGEIRVHVHNTNSNDMALEIIVGSADKKAGITVETAGNITRLSSQEGSTQILYALGVGTYDIRITSKYDIIQFKLAKASNVGQLFNFTADNYIYIDTADVSFSSVANLWGVILSGDVVNINKDKTTKLRNIQFGTGFPMDTSFFMSGNIANFVGVGLMSINLQDGAQNLYGDIASLANETQLQLLKLSAFTSPYKFTGNIASLGKLVNANVIGFGFMPNPGAIEDMAKAMYDNGRTLRLEFSANYATINGVASMTGVYIDFTQGTGIVITRRSDSSVLATYTASTNSWTYA